MIGGNLYSRLFFCLLMECLLQAHPGLGAAAQTRAIEQSILWKTDKLHETLIDEDSILFGDGLSCLERLPHCTPL